MNASKSPVAAVLVTGLLIPLMQRWIGRPLTDQEMVIAMAAPAAVAHWIETTPLLARARAWWVGKPASVLSPIQMAQIVPEVVKMAVPVLQARMDRDLKQ